MDILAEYTRADRRRLQAAAADAHRRRLRQRHRRRLGARRSCAPSAAASSELYSRGRRRLPESPSRPEQAGEPGRPDRRGRRRRRRARPRLRRRRRPARRRHQGRQDHLSRPPADAVRARRAAAQPGRADPVRRQVLAAPGAADPRRRRRAGDVEDRALAGQGEDEGARRAARRRDERPRLLRRALVRLRRRHLHRGAAARDPEPRAPIRARSSTPCPTSFSTPELNVACAEGEPAAGGRRGCAPRRSSPARARS